MRNRFALCLMIVMTLAVYWMMLGIFKDLRYVDRPLVYLAPVVGMLFIGGMTACLVFDEIWFRQRRGTYATIPR